MYSWKRIYLTKVRVFHHSWDLRAWLMEKDGLYLGVIRIFFWFVVKLCKGVKNQNYFIVLCTFWSKAKIWTCLIKNAFKIFNALVVFYWLLESKSIWRPSAFVEWKRNQGLMRALNLHSPSLHFGLETVVVYASTKSEYTNAFCFNQLSLCVVSQLMRTRPCSFLCACLFD